MSKPSHAEIQECAYHKWMKAGCPFGRDLEFWIQAEIELIVLKYVYAPGFLEKELRQLIENDRKRILEEFDSGLVSTFQAIAGFA